MRLYVTLDPADIRTLSRRAGQAAGTPAARRTEDWIVLDTGTGALRAQGLVLLMVRAGRAWQHRLFRVPPDDTSIGTGPAAEWPAPGGRVAPDALPDRKLLRQVTRALSCDPLLQVATARILRQTWAAGDGVSLTLDRIAPAGGTPTAVVTVAAAPPADFGAALEAARTCVPQAGLHLGAPPPEVRLALGLPSGAASPRLARDVPLSPAQPAPAAAAAVLHEVTAHLRANILALRGGAGPEAAHQVRVALRRLRAALGLFRDALDPAAAARLGTEARWLGAEVGRLRDLDVIVDDVLLPEAAAHPGEPGFARLAEVLRDRGQAERAALTRTLAGPRTQDLLIDLVRLAARPADPGASVPVAALGTAALDRRWRKVRRMARGIATLDIEARHALRKELKKLRYGAEFLGTVFPARRVAGFVRRLKSLQEIFGTLNDAATAEHMLTGADAPGGTDPAMARAAGLVIGARRMRAAQDWVQAQDLWAALRDQRPFWR